MTHLYQIEIAPAAQRQLKKLSSELLQSILNQIQKLAFEPRPSGVKKLSGNDDFYRIRIKDYRVVYAINDKKLLILILKIGSRKEVYRSL